MRHSNLNWTIRGSVALAASAFFLLASSNARAEDQPAKTDVTVQQPAQAPVTVQAPQQPAPVIVQQPQQPATTTTTAAPYAPPSADRHTEKTIERRPNETLLKYGVGAFVLSYGASAVAGVVSNRDEDKNLFIPVAGPWMNLADRNCGAGCGSGEDVAKAMIVTSGIVQGAGVIMALSSLVIPETTSVSEESRSAKAKKPEVKVTPMSFAAGAGLGAVGRF